MCVSAVGFRRMARKKKHQIPENSGICDTQGDTSSYTSSYVIIKIACKELP